MHITKVEVNLEYNRQFFNYVWKLHDDSSMIIKKI